MNEQLRKALDQALAAEIGLLFKNLTAYARDDAAVNRFEQGLSAALVAYGRACLVIDRACPTKD